MAETRQAIISLGSNLGNRRRELARALELLGIVPGIVEIIESPVYETSPVGIKDQPYFLNMIAGLSTHLSPEELLDVLLEIELKMGRVRATRWGPRNIDLDLIFFESETRETQRLTLPHRRWAERAFVVIPLRELLNHPDFRKPEWEPLREKLCNLTPEGEVRKHD